MSRLPHHPDGPPVKVEILAETPGVAPVPATLVGRTILVTLPPGSPGAPPHRHPGPICGYVVKDAITFELEGQPERVIRAGEAFFEPGRAGADRRRTGGARSAQTPPGVTERRGVRSQLT